MFVRVQSVPLFLTIDVNAFQFKYKSICVLFVLTAALISSKNDSPLFLFSEFHVRVELTSTLTHLFPADDFGVKQI